MSNIDVLELKSVIGGLPLNSEAEALESAYKANFLTLEGLANFVYSCGGVRSAIAILTI